MAEKKELRIVFRKGTEAFAEYLEQLLAGREDVDASVWTEREYLDCKGTMTGTERVLFLGEGMALEQEGVTIPPRYEQFGMTWGVSGRYAAIIASERPVNGRKKIRAFLEYIEQNHPEIGPEELAAVAEENAMAWGESLKATVNPFASVLDSMFRTPVSSAGTITAIGRLQYKAAVMDFYRDGLAELLRS
jgi:hypothetical protein